MRIAIVDVSTTRAAVIREGLAGRIARGPAEGRRSGDFRPRK
jgi:hypothetical protein